MAPKRSPHFDGEESSQKVRKTSPAKKSPAKSPRKAFEPLSEPEGWRKTWDTIVELRADRSAVVDTMGCERLMDPSAPVADQEYQCLVSLMLSSQTKDTVNAAAMERLKAHGLTVDRILDETSEEDFHALLRGPPAVGFHNVKAKTIRVATQKLRDDHGGRVPPSMDALLELPGVGPKMALLVMRVAFDQTCGISVDTHVHRICNQLGWTGAAPTLDKDAFGAKDPEKTRRAIESWMPREIWSDVNVVLVGLGQEMQTEKPKLLKKALEASDPAAALDVLSAIGVDVPKVAKQEGLDL